MQGKLKGRMGKLLLGASMLLPLIGAGCAARTRYYGGGYYDSGYRDYHHWDRGDDRYYRDYCQRRYGHYRDWSSLSNRDRDDYWRWRHDHY